MNRSGLSTSGLRKAVTTFIWSIASPSPAARLARYRNDASLPTGAYVSPQSDLFGAIGGPRPSADGLASVNGLAKPGHRRIRGWPGCVQGHTRTQAIRGWPGPFTDNLPHAKLPAVHNKDRILDSIILLIRISYLPVCAIHEFSPDLKKTYGALHASRWVV